MEGKHWIVGIVIVLIALFIGVVLDTGNRIISPLLLGVVIDLTFKNRVIETILSIIGNI